jgi:SAM-dependent methyltransferase
MEIANKRVVEVGSHNVNGSARPLIEALGPAEYVGVDITPGLGVDVVLDAEHLLDRFEPGSFDVVISTEMVEHVRDWRKVFNNMKRLCAPGGWVVVTTRSRGFQYHGYPNDFWRYEMSDMMAIFADFSIEVLEKDPNSPGVYVAARERSMTFTDLDPIALYSMCTDDRRIDVSDFEVWKKLAAERIGAAKRRVGLWVRHDLRSAACPTNCD